MGSLPEYRVIFLWDDNEIDKKDILPELDFMIETMRLRDSDFSRRLVRDEASPDYIFASDKCLGRRKSLRALKHYLKHNSSSVFIFFTYECIEPNLNLFDYAFTWNPDLKCGDRIARNFPYMYDFRNDAPLTNTLTLEEARAILSGSPRFCNFIYSHKSDPRDTLFRLLSQYKPVDSLGRYLNYKDKKDTREDSDWYGLSISMKRGYKFSIAAENASSRGYTTEKIISSLQAHTVPIYWGDPAITEYINPKAFINCHDYESLDEVTEKVKEIDQNDDLWLDMVTQPWQTEEQRAKTIREAEEYDRAVRHIFSQDITKARRRPKGWVEMTYRHNYRGLVPPLSIRVLRWFRGTMAKIIPIDMKLRLKAIMRLD